MDLFEFSKNKNVQLHYTHEVFCVMNSYGTYKHYGESISDLIPFVTTGKMVFAFFSGNTGMAGIDIGDGNLIMRDENETFYQFIDKVFG